MLDKRNVGHTLIPQIVLFPTIPFLSHYDSDMPPLNVGHFLHCAYETTLFLSVRIEFLAL